MIQNLIEQSLIEMKVIDNNKEVLDIYTTLKELFNLIGEIIIRETVNEYILTFELGYNDQSYPRIIYSSFRQPDKIRIMTDRAVIVSITFEEARAFIDVSTSIEEFIELCIQARYKTL